MAGCYHASDGPRTPGWPLAVTISIWRRDGDSPIAPKSGRVSLSGEAHWRLPDEHPVLSIR